MSINSKRAIISQACKNNDFRTALRVAATIQARKNETDLHIIQNGWDALQNPSFYKQIGKNPELIVEYAIQYLKEKFT